MNYHQQAGVYSDQYSLFHSSQINYDEAYEEFYDEIQNHQLSKKFKSGKNYINRVTRSQRDKSNG